MFKTIGAGIGRIVAREPVILGNVALAWFALSHPTPGVFAAMTISIGWVVRLLAAPNGAVKDAHEVGYNKAVTDLNLLDTETPPSTSG